MPLAKLNCDLLKKKPTQSASHVSFTHKPIFMGLRSKINTPYKFHSIKILKIRVPHNTKSLMPRFFCLFA